MDLCGPGGLPDPPGHRRLRRVPEHRGPEPACV